MPISQERAERIARAHACIHCQEYSYKKVAVRPAEESIRRELRVAWTARLVCGICGTPQELGIDDDGDVVYAG